METVSKGMQCEALDLGREFENSDDGSKNLTRNHLEQAINCCIRWAITKSKSQSKFVMHAPYADACTYKCPQVWRYLYSIHGEYYCNGTTKLSSNYFARTNGVQRALWQENYPISTCLRYYWIVEISSETNIECAAGNFWPAQYEFWVVTWLHLRFDKMRLGFWNVTHSEVVRWSRTVRN